VRSVGARKPVFASGDEAAHVLVLRRGGVKLSLTDRGGCEHILAILGPGTIVGTEAARTGHYQCDATALCAAQMCVVPADDLRTMMGGDASVLVGFAAEVVKHLQQSRALMACRGPVRASAKVAAWLLQFAVPTQGSKLEVARFLTLRELGAMVGVSAETACRALAELEQEGLVRATHDGWEVIDAPRLERWARDGAH
jgi:CRP-like cAMP-binding protein